MWLAIFALGPVAIAFAVSLALPISILNPRYLTLAVIPYLLLWAVALDALEPKALRRVVIAAAMVWAVFGFREEARRGERTIGSGSPKTCGAPNRAGKAPPSLSRACIRSCRRSPFGTSSSGPAIQVRDRDQAEAGRDGGPAILARLPGVLLKPAITRAMLDELAGKGYRVEKSFQSGAEDHRVHLDLFVRSPAPAPEAPPRSSPP